VLYHFSHSTSPPCLFYKGTRFLAILWITSVYGTYMKLGPVVSTDTQHLSIRDHRKGRKHYFVKI
jgi:hypothetical protein